MAEDDGSTKRCPMCSITKSIACFGVDKKAKTGLRCYCGECTRERGRKYAQEHKVENRKRTKAWRLKTYGVKLRRRVPKEVQVKKKNIARNKRRASNPQKYRDQAKVYYKNNSAIFKLSRDRYSMRRKKNGGFHTQADIRLIFQMQRGRCAYCRCSLKSYYEVDHIAAVANGGTHDRRNLQLTCRACNGRKKSKDPICFAQSLGLLL